MERFSILIDKRHIDLEVGYNTEKISILLCEYCGKTLSTKQSMKHHMLVKHSEKVMTYRCSKCPTTCNRLVDIRRHIRKQSIPIENRVLLTYKIYKIDNFSLAT